MRARFQRDIGGRTPGPVAGILQRIDFRMRLTRNCMPAFADYLAVSYENAAHHRVGVRSKHALPCKPHRSLHESVISR